MTNIRVVELQKNGINIEIDGVQVISIDIPSGYVPYSFMPLIDQHVILTGEKLRDGMIVLVETAHRENPEVITPEYPSRRQGFRPTEYDRKRVQETARWALVTDFTRRGEIIDFTAIYADGTMAQRGGYNQSIKWSALKNFKFQGVKNSEVCEECGLNYEDAQPFSDLMDAAADLAGSFLFPEGETKEERISAVKKMLWGTFGDLKEELNSIFTEQDLDDSEAEEGIRDGETPEEYADRLRDEAEIANEYDANEAAKLRQQKLDEEALAALREKLSGVPRPTR